MDHAEDIRQALNEVARIANNQVSEVERRLYAAEWKLKAADGYVELKEAKARIVSLENEVEKLKKDREVSERHMNRYARTLTGVDLALKAHYKGV